MEAASNPGSSRARAVTHETFGNESTLPLRGGSFNGNTSGAGVFAFNLNEPRANSNHNVGFRAAFLSGQIPEAQGLRVRAERQKGLVSVPIGEVGKKYKPHGRRQ